MGRTLIQNATMFTATGADAFTGDLLVEGNRIVSVGPGAGGQAADAVIDATGLFCMPGMTEGHAHLSFENVGATEDLITPSPETQAFTAARGAKNLIEAGFTSAYGASEAKLKLAVAVREEVNAGRLPGPRIRAGGMEISVTGAMGDESTLHNPRIGPATIVDGVEEMRKAVRLHCREGIDNIKLDVSGDPFYPNTPGHTTPMTFDEIRTAAETAHAYGRKINAHTRSVEGSKHCVRAGVDGLFHVEYSDAELLDMMEEAKDHIFVVPTVGLFAQIMAGEAAGHGLTPEVGGYMNIPELLEHSVKTHTELRKRGIRHLIGGDYGFGWSPHGTQGRDIQSFVDLYGYSPADALICATRNGGLAMGYGGDLGTLEEGKLADLILVDGNPLADLSVLSGPEKVAFVMRDGLIQKMSPALAAKQNTPAPEAHAVAAE
ncbi:metal-dependent hydrolase family protein [Novosphingobium beihaiensis]|uniref:Amidohydrolase family protein n=1 Tax=Novosphingobium beihaiensis TaxID=2930389 RepID=A0ABT0BTW5_9SPHN|nr:amidohydrolase family protein [Novosphingobium beihaiensis]MCJ2188502.1 amidohydrolase family protein [Novosphingobium beihaiensis]